MLSGKTSRKGRTGSPEPEPGIQRGKRTVSLGFGAMTDRFKEGEKLAQSGRKGGRSDSSYSTEETLAGVRGDEVRRLTFGAVTRRAWAVFVRARVDRKDATG